MGGYVGETVPKQDQPVQMGSNRSFGLVFSAFFCIVALYPVVHGLPLRIWALAVAAAFLAIALIYPRLLEPLNRVWFRLGMLMHKVMSPLILGLLFYLTIAPIGLLMRMSGHDPLRLKRDPNATSYWVLRKPPGPAPETLKNQF